MGLLCTVYTSKRWRPSANGIVKSFIGEDGIVDAWECCLWETGGALFMYT